MPTTTKKIWLWFIPLALVAAAASSAGVYTYVMRERAHTQATRTAPAVLLLVNVAPMTVNLHSANDEPAMLYVGFNLEVGNEATRKLLELYMPKIRSQLLTVLSGQDSTALSTPEGKKALAARILELLRRALSTEQPDAALLGVLYTDFIVQ
ncbi:flagellar basal body-associated FliL family protein [Pseudomonas putida]|jgi:flagellar FliL protein|uniref:flagellar basal body-associated FliL family protein n=1 Tax=Pseudomonas TaxID=286 RepID=UPI00062A3D2D|nr:MULTISPECIES: flagellar basal body-associated FliL family protein [Pseudomonas]QPN45691.1 flagellar basal body-associated FliL family protein [Priestia aryabhattai]KAF1305435.1 flagellar basal body protein FliL [Pseudomonas sp. SG-MS2]MBG6125277.1 flagellar FliL protein [Pseudomonas sp. M2]NSX18656.1 flagellar basal body-associated FliL family protein [Pseudomonas putida]RRV47085.1 flagellar basal body-associated protein FliL [Pseudomonas sp. p106]